MLVTTGVRLQSSLQSVTVQSRCTFNMELTWNCEMTRDRPQWKQPGTMDHFALRRSARHCKIEGAADRVLLMGSERKERIIR